MCHAVCWGALNQNERLDAARRAHEGVDVPVRRARVPLRDRGPGGGPPCAGPQARSTRRSSASRRSATNTPSRPSASSPGASPSPTGRCAISASRAIARSGQPQPAPGAVPNATRATTMAARLPRLLRRGLDRRRLRRAGRRRHPGRRAARPDFAYLASPERFLGLLDGPDVAADGRGLAEADRRRGRRRRGRRPGDRDRRARSLDRVPLLDRRQPGAAAGPLPRRRGRRDRMADDEATSPSRRAGRSGPSATRGTELRGQRSAAALAEPRRR